MTEVNLNELTVSQRARRFAARSRANKIERIAARVLRIFPRISNSVEAFLRCMDARWTESCGSQPVERGL